LAFILKGNMELNLENTIALLARGPATFDALLRGLPAVWTETNEGEGTWNARIIIAHLIHCEREDWLSRARLILETGESQPFAPFHRDGYLPYAQGKSLSQLLDQFATLRSENLDALRALNLTPAELALRGTHPTFGAVTLSQLLATWATHDLTHLHQISRIMAYQYLDAVGPWSRFQGVMQCTGHSSAA
jgi:hypothetical protein